MNSEIKFRGWNSWLREDETPYNTMVKFSLFDTCAIEDLSTSAEIMQYIGLDDKNKTEIYVGDFVKALNRNYDCEDDREKYFQTFQVTFLNGCYMFGNWNAHEFFNKFIHKEVVGNIYE